MGARATTARRETQREQTAHTGYSSSVFCYQILVARIVSRRHEWKVKDSIENIIFYNEISLEKLQFTVYMQYDKMEFN